MHGMSLWAALQQGVRLSDRIWWCADVDHGPEADLQMVSNHHCRDRRLLGQQVGEHCHAPLDFLQGFGSARSILIASGGLETAKASLATTATPIERSLETSSPRVQGCGTCIQT